MINDEIELFGRSIGVENLALNEAGCLRFIFENNIHIHIEQFEDTIFFFITKTYELSPLPYNYYLSALSMNYRLNTTPFPVEAIAKTDQDVGFFVRIKENQCDQPTLYKVFQFLLQYMRQFENKVVN